MHIRPAYLRVILKSKRQGLDHDGQQRYLDSLRLRQGSDARTAIVGQVCSKGHGLCVLYVLCVVDLFSAVGGQDYGRGQGHGSTSTVLHAFHFGFPHL